MTRRNLLAIDFDAFFPTLEGEHTRESALYDWGHRETLFFIEAIWPLRAAEFLALDLPLPDVDRDTLASFWSTVNLAPDATLHVAESNSAAAAPAVADGINGLVVNLDAHHDAGYSTGDDPEGHIRDLAEQGVWSCEDWLVYYQLTAGRVAMRYPTWRAEFAMANEPEPALALDRSTWDPAEWSEVTFDRVFLCRSGAWVPPWCDDALVDLAGSFPGRGGVTDEDATRGGRLSALRPRPFDRDQAATIADQQRDLAARAFEQPPSDRS